MQDGRIRVGLIGAGRNTRTRHIPGLLAQPGVEIVAVANRSRESSERAARELGILRAAAHWMEIVDDDEIDAVCVGTWPYMHAPITIAALERGKHVLCEARMAMNSVEARAMLEASRRHPHLVAQIVPAPSTFAVDGTIVDLISAGAIGNLISLDARIALDSDFPKYDAPLHWRHQRELSGNNVMAMGIWYECMMRWVGPAADVFAVGQTVVSHRRDQSGRRISVGIPDHLDIVGRLEQGGQMRFAISAVLGHVPAMVDVGLFGTDGTIRVTRRGTEELEVNLGKRGEKELRPVSIDPARKGTWRVEEEFVRAIRGEEEVKLTDFATGLKYMEWTDAVARSRARRELVPLPLT